MAGRVAGKVVLLTGGAMGLGKAATKALMAEGATVIITCRRTSPTGHAGRP
jgi:3(or 17)beta-hydroxysteroid dehydrogenase